MFCSVRKSQQELVSVYLWGLLCQLLDEFAAVEAAAPSDRRWIDAATLQAATERLAVPKKLLACNTKLKLKIT